MKCIPTSQAQVGDPEVQPCLMAETNKRTDDFSDNMVQIVTSERGKERDRIITNCTKGSNDIGQGAGRAHEGSGPKDGTRGGEQVMGDES